MELKHNYKINIVKVIVLSILFILCSCKSNTDFGYYSIPDFKGGNEIFFTLKNVSYEEIKNDSSGNGGLLLLELLLMNKIRNLIRYILLHFFMIKEVKK